SAAVVFDAHISMGECGWASVIGDAVARGDLANLPEQLQFRQGLPASKVETIISNSGDGLIDVIKVIHFNKPVSAQIASSLCRGEGFAPVFRPGPWAVKKAFPWLLKRISGYRVRWNTPEERRTELLRMSQSQTTWSTDNENFSEGIRFINEHAPEYDACNEQTYWVLTCTKPDSATPIAGWPETKVQEALFLDDPLLSRVSIADFKSFVTVDEDGTCDVGASINNAFYNFDGDREKDILAVMKRAIFFVFTESALYIRLPSEQKDAIIHRVVVDNVHKDLIP
ncbi:unnamed protein product, partial [Symbiodinium necroappetens]